MKSFLKILQWWLKWWNFAAALSLVFLTHSEPPQLWFWLVAFGVFVLYGVERSING
ncbi:MAG: hypothetical protein WCO81_06285 [Cyanobacteriota bacterium ELA615]|jgi:hypothetical protein